MDRETLVEAKEAAFEQVKQETNLLGAWDTFPSCPYDHKAMWMSGFDAALAYHAKQTAEKHTLQEKAEKLAKLEAWVNEICLANWRDGVVGFNETKGNAKLVPFDVDGSIIENQEIIRPTVLEAIYAYLEQAEG